MIPPLRHPLLIAKELATLDLLSRGRLVVQPTVSWHRAEYDALGVPFETRGERLDEHLEAWSLLWRDAPASFEGRHYSFDDVWLEPKPFRPDGPRLWFGGQRLHDRLLRRLVTYGHGFNPLGRPSDDDLARLAAARSPTPGATSRELEMVGGTRGVVPRRRPTRRRSTRRSTRSRNRRREASARSASSRASSPTTEPRSPTCCGASSRASASAYGIDLVHRQTTRRAVATGATARSNDRSIAARSSCCAASRWAATALSSALNFGNSTSIVSSAGGRERDDHHAAVVRGPSGA